ncbi:ABC transporter substrate-binding protein [Reyranella sp.]|uniref:ABC transporter substrate-binding protein n=1 Tax=Reyranella sp. TaxID=1929291 RepID=UPI003D0D84F2
MMRTGNLMRRKRPGLAARFGAALLAATLGVSAAALPVHAQKAGGVLRGELADTPPSPSLHEEITVSVAVPFMAVFNNLVIYDQSIARNTFDSIRPELATGWTVSDDGLTVRFDLRQGVKWHDGTPFSSADVKCTFDMLMDKGEVKLRRNPRGVWYENVEKVTADGDFQITFHLKVPQPSLLAFLAAGWTAIYPCHVPPAQMRRHPIGTGPFKFVELKSNERVKLEKNRDYWKPGRPYLDGIEYSIISNRATRMLAFTAGRADMTFPTDVTVPLLKDTMQALPTAQCTLRPLGVSYNLILNRDAAPFNDARARSAVALAIDRKAFIDITSEGKDLIGGAMLPPPAGVWGVGPEALKDLPGYGGDIEASREKGRALMREAGYGPDKRLKIKVSTRNVASYRDLAVILVDHLRHIYIDGELEMIDSAVYFNRLYQKNYSLVLNATGSSLDDPDQHFVENYGCAAPRNFNGYCNPELTALMSAQSRERDTDKRRAIVHQIERKLVEDTVRPIISHTVAAGCMQPQVKGLTLMSNSIYNGWRFEDVWLDR